MTDAQKAVLTDIQIMQYDSAATLEENTENETVQIQCVDLIATLESLADTRIESEARRKMLEKLQFSEKYYSEPKFACPVCHCNEYHASDCALNALLTPKEE